MTTTTFRDAAVDRPHPGRTAAAVIVSVLVLLGLLVAVALTASTVLDLVHWTMAG